MVRYLVITTAIIGSFLSSPAVAQDAELKEMLGLSLEELTVYVASKRNEAITDAPGIVTVITKDDMEHYGANTLFDVIQRVPNIDINRVSLTPTGGSPTIRGQSPTGVSNRLLHLIDGRPFRESQLGGWNLPLYRAFPLEMIERIEVIRGPGSVLYGSNAFSGVINIVTKKPDRIENQGTYLSATYGSFNTKITENTYRAYNEDHDFSMSAAFKFLDSAGWDYALTDINGVSDSQRLAKDGWSGYLRNEYKNLTINAYKAQVETNTQGLLPSWPFGIHKIEREFLDIGYVQPISGDWKASFNITYNGFENHATDGTAMLADKNNFHDILYEVSVSGSLWDELNIVAGATFDDRRGTLKIGSSPFDETVEGFYVQADYKPADWVKLIGGLQFNRPESREVAAISPRLGAIVHFTPEFGGKLLYGEAFRSAVGSETRLNIPGIIGSPDLKSETIQTTEAQIFYHTSEYYGALTLYQSKTFDTIDIGVNPNGPGLTFFNGGKENHKGVELEGKAFLTDEFEIQGSFTYQAGENLTTGSNDISHQPHLMFKLGGSYASEDGYSIGIFNTYVDDVSGYRDDAPPIGKPNPPVEPTNLLTANVSVDLNTVFDWPTTMPKTGFSLYADNILDEDIYIQSATNGLNANTLPAHSGRAIYGRLSMRF